MSDRNERVRRRAHEIWESEGRPHGQDAEHWARAEREIDREEAAGSADSATGKASSPTAGGKRKRASAAGEAAPAAEPKGRRPAKAPGRTPGR